MILGQCYESRSKMWNPRKILVQCNQMENNHKQTNKKKCLLSVPLQNCSSNLFCQKENMDKMGQPIFLYMSRIFARYCSRSEVLIITIIVDDLNRVYLVVLIDYGEIIH